MKLVQQTDSINQHQQVMLPLDTQIEHIDIQNHSYISNKYHQHQNLHHHNQNLYRIMTDQNNQHSKLIDNMSEDDIFYDQQTFRVKIKSKYKNHLNLINTSSKPKISLFQILQLLLTTLISFLQQLWIEIIPQCIRSKHLGQKSQSIMTTFPLLHCGSLNHFLTSMKKSSQHFFMILEQNPSHLQSSDHLQPSHHQQNPLNNSQNSSHNQQNKLNNQENSHHNQCYESKSQCYESHNQYIQSHNQCFQIEQDLFDNSDQSNQKLKYILQSPTISLNRNDLASLKTKKQSQFYTDTLQKKINFQSILSNETKYPVLLVCRFNYLEELKIMGKIQLSNVSKQSFIQVLQEIKRHITQLRNLESQCKRQVLSQFLQQH